MNAVAPISRTRYTRDSSLAENTFAATTDEIRSRYFQRGSAAARRSPELDALDELAALNDNWDGRNSRAPESLAIDTARRWLDDLRMESYLAGRPWVSPHVSVGDDGEVTLEWWRQTRKISLYFGTNQPEFVKVWGPHIQNDMDSGVLQSSTAFRALWVWLHTRT